MKIQSRVKDYYDYVAHIYGGGDPKNTYVRDYIIPDQVSDASDKFEETETLREPEFEMWVPSDYERHDNRQQQFFGIAVAGKVYVVTRAHKDPIWNYGNKAYEGGETEPWQIARWGDTRRPRKFHRYSQLDKEREQQHDDSDFVQCGVKVANAVSVSKKLNAPIFKFDCDRGTRVYGRYPLLSEYGIPAVLPPEQAYQEISMFRMSVINQSPDSMPRADMTNVQKVESHGFDKRISFRHRK